MDVLKTLIKFILIEGKTEDLQKKYPDLDVIQLSTLDPSSTKKFLDWICKQSLRGHNQPDIAGTVTAFARSPAKFKKRDINQYVDLKELEDEIKDLDDQGSSKRKQQMTVKTSGADKVYEDDNVVCLWIASKEASQFYGKGTRWCISGLEGNYFDGYVERGAVFYFLISKSLPRENPLSKIAIVCYVKSPVRNNNETILSNEFYNAPDKSIDVGEVNDHLKSQGVKIDLIALCNSDKNNRPLPLSVRVKYQPEKVTEKEAKQFFDKDDTARGKLESAKYINDKWPQIVENDKILKKEFASGATLVNSKNLKQTLLNDELINAICNSESASSSYLLAWFKGDTIDRTGAPAIIGVAGEIYVKNNLVHNDAGPAAIYCEWGFDAEQATNEWWYAGILCGRHDNYGFSSPTTKNRVGGKLANSANYMKFQKTPEFKEWRVKSGLDVVETLKNNFEER
jgi:hypothetical protein